VREYLDKVYEYNSAGHQFDFDLLAGDMVLDEARAAVVAADLPPSNGRTMFNESATRDSMSLVTRMFEEGRDTCLLTRKNRAQVDLLTWLNTFAYDGALTQGPLEPSSTLPVQVSTTFKTMLQVSHNTSDDPSRLCGSIMLVVLFPPIEAGSLQQDPQLRLFLNPKYGFHQAADDVKYVKDYAGKYGCWPKDATDMADDLRYFTPLPPMLDHMGETLGDYSVELNIAPFVETNEFGSS